MNATTDSEQFITMVEQDLARVEHRAQGYRRRYGTLVICGLVASALATVLAGSMAAGGKGVADALGGWRLGCSVAAVLSMLATVAASLQQQLRLNDHASASATCAALLSALRFSLRVSGADLRSSQDKYREILEKYHVYLAR